MRYINSPFHVLSDEALTAIGEAVKARAHQQGRTVSEKVRIELHNFCVDITSELQHRGVSDTSYSIAIIDNSDLLG